MGLALGVLKANDNPRENNSDCKKNHICFPEQGINWIVGRSSMAFLFAEYYQDVLSRTDI